MGFIYIGFLNVNKRITNNMRKYKRVENISNNMIY